MIVGNKELQRRDLANALASISNLLYAIQHRPASWDEKLKAIESIHQLLPGIRRYLIYFKNTGG